ncbi:phosphatidylethanolamine:Kdo2-lipid A phosphoethanolamine transferase [Paraglaciecola sp. T6c]|uniref:phosphoethanolamine transferase n=1 Tax=Pseudoalteromonas atlantica (strain T6c / ATCC BAA-1087) TaxID=3042615 RepID=UPI00005C5F04|nr:phosphoethanolamine--lipid A transferase [Paraglaciecola sp. T6c]ABG41941.1 phosphatidylethanolamine:Kdo2-lipid A phosphoethanolamine transferase [Paraglaciecola sp. T6c]
MNKAAAQTPIRSEWLRAFKIPPQLVMLLAALFVTLTGNHTFFGHLETIYSWQNNALFICSVGAILWALTSIVSIVLNWFMPVKLALSIVLITGAICSYFTDGFGVIFDIDMMRNMFATDTSEAADILNFGLLNHVLLFGAIPIVFFNLLPLNKQPRLKDIKRRFLMTGFTLVIGISVIGGSLFAFSGQYASFFREHKSVRYYTNPIQPMYSFVAFLTQKVRSAASRQFVFQTSRAAIPDTDLNRELVIVVVGETARADHFSVNGYERETTPLLAKETDLVSFSQISSCGTSTAVSVPCMFSILGRDDFDADNSKTTENVLDIVAKANISVQWRDNNSDSKGVAERIPYISYKTSETNPVCDEKRQPKEQKYRECRDEGMLDGLQEFINGQEQDILIVLHQMGSHGPAYSKRYPSAFEKFTPACQTSELSMCSDEEIINAYDNTILYTDYFLAKVIGLLKRNTPRYETAMIYVSDHGESLGENKVYLHGLPYMFAPKAQTHVPIIVWAGASSDIDIAKTRELKDLPNSHDALAQAILLSMEVDSDVKLPPMFPLLVMKSDD